LTKFSPGTFFLSYLSKHKEKQSLYFICNDELDLNRILSHPKNYPGKHQEPQPRTLQAFKPLEAKAQFHVIFKAVSEYVKENLTSGKSVNIRGFGAFSFEILSEFVKPAVFTNIDFRKTLDDQRAERKHNHKFRPCFLADTQLKTLLTRSKNKEEIVSIKSQNSVYQQGFGMIFCNPTPIATACYLGRETVSSAIQAFVVAVTDLTRLGYDLDLDFGFCRVVIRDKTLSYNYKADLVQQVNNLNFEKKIKRSVTPTSSFWKNTQQEKWNSSTLSKLYKVPEPSKVQTLAEKTLALKIMSLDMNTTEKTQFAKIKNIRDAKLPVIGSKKPSGAL